MKAKRTKLLDMIERDPDARLQLRRVLSGSKREIVQVGGETWEVFTSAGRRSWRGRGSAGRVLACDGLRLVLCAGSAC